MRRLPRHLQQARDAQSERQCRQDRRQAGRPEDRFRIEEDRLRQALPGDLELDSAAILDEPGQVDRRATGRRRRPSLLEVQESLRSRGLRAHRSEGRPDLGQAQHLRAGSCAPQLRYGLSDLPFVVGAELLRMPSPDEGQHAPSDPAVRRRHDAQLDQLQLPDPARRRLHDGARRIDHRQSDLARPIVMRGAGQLLQRRSRRDLHAAAAGVGAGVLGGGLQHRGAPYGPHGRNQALHRLSHLQGQRQQRDDGAAPDAGNQLHEFHRALRLGRRGTRGSGRDRGHRARRAAGGVRQHAAQARVSRRIRAPSPRTGASSASRIITRPPNAAASRPAASISTRPTVPADSTSTTSRTSTTKTSPSASTPRRSRRSASGPTSRPATRPRSRCRARC